MRQPRLPGRRLQPAAFDGDAYLPDDSGVPIFLKLAAGAKWR
jgi:hypothetical protein